MRRAIARLRDERGQSLVFFVLVMTVLFAVAALVVNVGNWLQAKQRLQGGQRLGGARRSAGGPA